MALVASCSGVYFLHPPMDNVLTLTWQRGADGDPPAPYSSVIFKVKSTAPELFYVLPRYGALLLTDADGRPRDSCSADVMFSLRPGAADALGKMTAGAGGRRVRFAVEYAVLAADRLAHDRLAQGLRGGGRLSEAVRGVWGLVVAGTLRAAQGRPITLSVHTEENIGGKDDGGTTAPPPTARLVRPSLREQTLSHLSMASTRETSRSVSFSARSERRANDVGAGERRASRPGADAVRQETAANFTNTAAATADVSHKGTRRRDTHAQAQGDVMDTIMSVPQTGDYASLGAKGGLPLYSVVVMMFVTYVGTMLFLRGGGNE